MATQRSRPVVALVSVGVVAVVVAAMMLATGTGSPAVAFQQVGHWVFNRGENSVAHVDSGTKQVDARVPVPGVGDDGVFVVQGDTQGYLVGRTTVTVFGKSDLTVESSSPTGQTELPTGLEIAGGPYLVYRQAGTIVRLGVPTVSIPVGGSVGRPIGLDDGTVWVHRPDNGALCALRRDAVVLDCPFRTPAGAAGSLTVLGSVPVFVDTTTDTFQLVTPDAPAPVPAGVDLPGDALVGDRDSNGRLPVVASGPNRLLLLDTSGTPQGSPAAAPPMVVPLGDGTFGSPVASDGVVAVVETASNQLRTFKIDGTPLTTVTLPAGSGPAFVVRGPDGKIFVDDVNGAQTHIVNPDGAATSIRTGLAVVPGASATAESQDALPGPNLPQLPAPRSADKSTVPPAPNDGRPGAVNGLIVATDVGQGPGSYRVTAKWQKPDLSSRPPDYYQVTVANFENEIVDRKITAADTGHEYLGDICLAPYTVKVVPVAKKDDGQSLFGPERSAQTKASAPAGSCAVRVDLALVSKTATSATLMRTLRNPIVGYSGRCAAFNIEDRPITAPVWSGFCGAFNDKTTIDINLGPNGRYAIVMKMEQIDKTVLYGSAAIFSS